MIFRVAKANHHTKNPWGYDRDPEDNNLLIPDQKALSSLTDVVPYVQQRGISIRDAVKFITLESGRSISYEGLRRIAKLGVHPAVVERERATEES